MSMHRQTASRPTDVYRLYDAAGGLLYVGISVNAYARIEVHQREARWWSDVRHVAIEQYPERCVAEWIEADAIRDEGPIHNVTRNYIRWRPTPERALELIQPLEIDEWDEAA